MMTIDERLDLLASFRNAMQPAQLIDIVNEIRKEVETPRGSTEYLLNEEIIERKQWQSKAIKLEAENARLRAELANLKGGNQDARHGQETDER
jgi:hypothetical protein